MNNRRNYYRIMHVQPDAPVEIIKSSYRTLMQRLRQHPDLGGDHWNAALINEAYRVLTNPESRERYDHERQLIHRGMSAPEPVDDTEDMAARAADDFTADDVSEPNRTCPFCLMPHDSSKIENPDTVCPNCESPLRPASKWQFERTGQRAVNRIPALLDIAYFTTWPQSEPCPGQALDISPNGMRIRTGRRLGEGRRLKITSSIIDAIAVVTHCERDTACKCWSVGVAFETLRLARAQGNFFFDEA